MKPAGKAILIAGATASGKSQLALALARRIGGTVINADSMQVYRELRVLTARPSPDDERLVPHLLYGHVSAGEAYSVARWLEELRGALAEVRGAGGIPIIVGGTGLFFTAACEGLADIPPIPAPVRARVRAALAAEGVPALHAALSRLDPVMADRLRASDAQRVARALEVIEGTGQSLAVWQARGAAPVVPLDTAYAFVLSLPRKELYARIDARFAAMIEAGALEEARRFAGCGFDRDVPAQKALGLRPLIEAAGGRLELAEAVTQGQIQSRQYAKRQLTWFRNKMISWNTVDAQYLERSIEEIFSIMAH